MRWTRVKGPCVLPLLRDALSHVRSWPLPVKGWKMRHHRPDFKVRPPTGVYFQKRVSGGYKSTTMNTGPTSEPCCQLLLALHCRHKPSLGKKPECRGTTGVRTLASGGPQRCQKKRVSTWTLLAEGKMRRSGRLFHFKADTKVVLLESMTQKESFKKTLLLKEHQVEP